MDKWYESKKTDDSPIISSRIRLARNLKKYPFSICINPEQTASLLEELKSSVKNDRTTLSNHFEYINIDDKSEIEKRRLLEKHVISTELLKNDRKKAVLVQDDETVSIMLNEEDHLRIQAIYPGDDISKAWELASRIDDLIEESVEYAFDSEFGYLTSCPTNTGTGLRASYMLHLPVLEKTGQLKNIVPALNKFGMIVRGIYGEGTEPLGSIYQVSNQLTMGKSEQDIIAALKNVVSQITEKERWLAENAVNTRETDVSDSVYRAYGILTNSRKISTKEAMSLLSEIRFGYAYGILKESRPKLNIYNIMMNIQPGSLQSQLGRQVAEQERDYYRAEYIRSIF